MESNPVRFFNRELPQALDEARAEVADFLGAAPGSVAFVHNATTAASTVLACFPLEPGDAVLVTDHAYGAVRIAATRRTGDAGARLDTVHVPLEDDGRAVADAVLAAVHPGTRLVILDQVTSPTARRMPLGRSDPGSAVARRGRPGRRRPRAGDARARPGPARRRLLDRQPAQVGLRAARHCRPARRRPVAAPPASARRVVARGGRLPRRVQRHRDPRPHRLAVGAAGAAPAGAPRPGPAAPAQRRARRRRPARGRRLARRRAGGPAARPGRQHAAGPAARRGRDHVADAAALQDRIAERAAVEVAVTTWAGRGFVRLSAQAYNAPGDYRRLAEDLPSLL